MPKNDFRVSKSDGVKRDVLIALRTTKDERAEIASKIKAAGFTSFQDAFDAFVGTASPSGALSKTEHDYMMKRARADLVERRLKARKLGAKSILPVLVNLYRAELKVAGHEPSGIRDEITDDWEMLITNVLDKWPGDIADVLTFKEWIGLWKDLFGLRRKILGESVKPPAVAPASPSVFSVA